MKRSDFNYYLPPQLIAQHPSPERECESAVGAGHGALALSAITAFTNSLIFSTPTDLLVLNDTRVIPARLWGRKATGGKVELLIERLTGPYTALAHIRASKSPGPGSVIQLCERAAR